jgi:hypothetical protein
MPSGDLNPANYSAWELDPTTRDSTHIWTKWNPADKTLSTAQTAENLFTVDTDAPAVNMATNPSMETGTPPTGYTASGSTPTRVTTNPRTGTYSLSIDPANSAASEGVYWTSDILGSNHEQSNGTRIIASCYFRRASGAGDDARIEIRDATGVTVLATGETVTLSTSYQRSTASYDLNLATSTGGVAYRVYLVSVTQHNTTFLADSFQVELGKSNVATAYCDGAQGINYSWDGTAHASTSRRRMGLVAIRGFMLRASHDCFVSFDQTASATTGRYLPANVDWWNPHPINIMERISFVNSTNGQTPRLYGDIWGVHSTKMSQ